MRVSKVLRAILGFTREVVIMSVEVVSGDRPVLRVHVRPQARRRGRCGRCDEFASWFDNGDGVRSWRHLDAGFATVELVALARRVNCGTCGPTVAAVPWARHASAFTRAFEDLVVHDAIVGNKAAAADRYGISWREVNNMCTRLATEALDRVDLLDGLGAAANTVGEAVRLIAREGFVTVRPQSGVVVNDPDDRQVTAGDQLGQVRAELVDLRAHLRSVRRTVEELDDQVSGLIGRLPSE